MKCKICNQEAGWFYPVFSFTGMCVSCKMYLERENYPKPSKDWTEHSKISEEACKKMLHKSEEK